MQQGDRVEDTPLNCGRIITVDAPASGTWQVRMVPSGRFWLAVHAKSDLSLTDAEFVEPDARAGIRPPRQNPGRADRRQTRDAARLRGRRQSRVRRFSLYRWPHGRFRQSICSPPTTWSSAAPSRFLPSHSAWLVNGRDESGIQAQRIWPRLFHGEFVEVVPPAGETVTAGTEMPVTFTIRNHGPAVRLSLVSSDHRGKVVAVEPSTLELGPGAEGIATVRLTVPADARPASEASVRLTATSDITAAVGGFNSASKTFIVIRE